jgi:hypothetical protein
VGIWPAGHSARIAALRLPASLTCFALGIIAAGFFEPLVNDSVISYLSTLGIAALFLFAAWKSIGSISGAVCPPRFTFFARAGLEDGIARSRHRG